MSSVLFPMSPLGPARTNVNSTLTPLPALHELKEFAFSATPLHGSAHLSSSDSSGSSPESIRNDSSGLFDSPRRSCESPYTEPEVQANVECLPETTRRPDVRDLAAQQALPGATSSRTLRLQLHNLPRPMPGSPAPIAITFVDAPSLSGECSISFDIIGRIAEGRFSQVWGAIAHSSHPALRSFPRHISIKMTWKGSLYMCANALSAVWNETRIMKQLAESRTPFVNAAVAVWQDDNYVYVASPRHTGALDEYLYTFPYMPSGAPPKVMPPAMFRVYAAELLLALDGLRAQGIAHCDIKTSNVFVSPAGHLTLADFDCSYSGLPTSEDEYWNTRLNGYPGSAEYMAPQISGTPGDASRRYVGFGFSAA